MYDYRQDLQTVLNSFGSQAPELTNGPAALRALANLIEQTPTKTTADASAPATETVATPPEANVTPVEEDQPEAAPEPVTVTPEPEATPAPSLNQPTGQDDLEPVKYSGEQFSAHQTIKNLILDFDGCLNQLVKDPLATVDFAPVEKRLTALIDDLSKEDQEALAGELGLAKSHLKRLKKVTASLHGAITNLVKEQAPTAEPTDAPEVKEATPAKTDNPAVNEAPVSPAPAKPASTAPATPSPAAKSAPAEPSFAELFAASVAKEERQAAKQPRLKAHHYLVRRQLNGAMLMDADHQDIEHITEPLVRQFGIQHGDEVVATPGHRDGTLIIKKVVGHAKDVPASTIATFGYGKVEKLGPGQLVVRQNVSGAPLVINGQQTSYQVETLSIERMEINEGSIVELAWYTGQPADVNPFEPHIRWHYPVEASAKPTIASQIRQAKPAPKQVAKPKPAAKPTYDLDLKGKKVAIIVGRGQSHVLFERIVKRYNGKPRIVDSFIPKKRLMERQLKGVDLIVMIAAYSKHATSWSAAEIAKKYDLPFTNTSSFSVQSFERALYRAAMGMRAYEPGGTDQADYRLSK